MVGSSGDHKTASTLIEEVDAAIERARRLRARTDLNLARSEFLLNVVQATSSPTLRIDLVSGDSYNNSPRNAIQNIAMELSGSS